MSKRLVWPLFLESPLNGLETVVAQALKRPESASPQLTNLSLCRENGGQQQEVENKDRWTIPTELAFDHSFAGVRCEVSTGHGDFFPCLATRQNNKLS